MPGRPALDASAFDDGDRPLNRWQILAVWLIAFLGSWGIAAGLGYVIYLTVSVALS